MSELIAQRVRATQVKAEQARRKAILAMHPDTGGSGDVRRLWLWIVDVVLLPERRAGNWAVSDALARALVEFPEIRNALADDRAAIERDDSAYQADLDRLKAEERATRSQTGDPHAR